MPRGAVMLEVNNHDDSIDFPKERPAALLSMYYERSAALVVLILRQEASKQLASPGGQKFPGRLIVYCEQRKHWW